MKVKAAECVLPCVSECNTPNLKVRVGSFVTCKSCGKWMEYFGIKEK